MIIEVRLSDTDDSLINAAVIHSESWKESHKDICSAQFIEKHSVAAQTEYLRNELKLGKRLYMLIKDKPVGIVSVKENLIENLYVLPSEQRKGYGSELLEFAIRKCGATPSLWVLSTNTKAYDFYTKRGFCTTGKKNVLSDTLSEIELTLNL